MPGRARMIRYASFVTQLDTSACAPSRRTIIASFDAEVVVAFFTPLYSAIIDSMTAMTMAMPRIDNKVEIPRAFRFWMLYLRGIIFVLRWPMAVGRGFPFVPPNGQQRTANPSHDPPQSIDDAHIRGTDRRPP